MTETTPATPINNIVTPIPATGSAVGIPYRPDVLPPQVGMNPNGIPIQQTIVQRSLFVSGIPKDLDKPEEVLTEIFRKAGNVTVKVCRDALTSSIMGYGYINYDNPAETDTALATLNYSEVTPGCELQLMRAERDPKSRNIYQRNTFLKNLPPSLTNKKLYELGREFGRVVSVKHAKSADNVFLNYGFIYFETAEEAVKAIEGLNNKEIEGNVITAHRYIPKSELREAELKTFTRVYICNIIENFNEDEFKEAISEHGKIKDVFINRPPNYNTKYAIVDMETHQEAVAVIDALKGSERFAPEGDKLYAGRLRHKKESEYSVNNGCTVYAKSLPTHSTEKFIRAVFNMCGPVEQVIMYRDAARCFLGSCIIHFSTPEAAAAAVEKHHNKPCIFENNGRNLYVQMWEPKEVRRKRMERMMLNFQRNQHMNAPSQMGPRMPPQQQEIQTHPPQPQMFQPQPFVAGQQYNMTPNDQQIYNGMQQIPPFNQPYVPPNFGYLQTMPQQHAPGIRQPMRDMPPMGFQHGVNLYQAQQAGPGINAQQQRSLRNQIKSIPHEQKKTFLGEQLYSRVHQFNATDAAKITGMLLELKIDEVIELIENPRLLEGKVAEAVKVLEEHKNKNSQQ